MNKLKKWIAAGGLLGLMFTLSGCVDIYKTGANKGTPTGEGWVYNLLVAPMSKLISFFVDMFNGNYGLAIIAITVIVRFVLFPLMVNQTRKSTYMSEKMQYVKPQIDALQARLKEATNPQEQMEAQKEMQQFYKDNNISMFGGIGCLPLLIQMPVFTALFYSVKFAPGIEHAAPFLGIDLSKPSYILVALAGIAYLAQSYISMIGMSEDQKKQMKMMTFMSPLMIVMISFSSPAGVTLYWVIGGLVSCLQSLYTNLVQKPKIRKQIEEEMALNPIKPVAVKEVKEAKPATKTTTKKLPNTPSKGLNAGKKQNIKK
ncbi:membrane protein insertase YidC [Vagococcus xieshaowenii]|uniref:Membrane protein insertase YidC n=1 Tax=Vagococcus xieshaowenii TaxID=2562451 RepID=A0AAJ5JLR7_9ENTE|nr:membrane protein insertase YidC [Vagococcus xieshaowenii]QCA28394.1 membrane protein insertase YidC [Vagococcus xieshaowenii]TFZ42850.1 membrane protein insertase YidC [Vagococcus xieshaowenii]